MGVFEYDRYLPALPVPKLSDTCEHLKKITKPINDKETWEKMCEALDAFVQEEGEELQEKLLSWQEEKDGNASWLRPIWDDIYLAYQDRLPVNMNYTFKLASKLWGELALEKLLYAFGHLLNRVRTGDLPVEKIRDQPLSMEALKHMIYTRIPDTFCDILHYPPSLVTDTVSVVVKGHWFLLSLKNETGELRTPEAIHRGLEKIRKESQALQEPLNVGALSGAPRREAAELRRELQRHPVNRMTLSSIFNSICVICLDEVDERGFMQNLLLGDSKNRWFDKSLQIISDGKNLGLNIEHAGCDAGVWIYLLTQADAAIRDGVWEDSDAYAHYRPLNFYVPKDLADRLCDARADYAAFVSKISIAEKSLKALSREKIRATKCRPDAVLQILYQATYYQLNGSFRSTYEAVATRSFYQGRTECIRPCTIAAVDFAKSFVEGTSDRETLLKKFRHAEQAHNELIANAQKGLGAERHLTGLLTMQTTLEENEALPAFFETEGFKNLKHNAISTSSMEASFIEYFGFCPVVPDGIGIGYGLGEDTLQMIVTAYHDSGISPHTFIETLEKLADRFFKLF